MRFQASLHRLCCWGVTSRRQVPLPTFKQMNFKALREELAINWASQCAIDLGFMIVKWLSFFQLPTIYSNVDTYFWAKCLTPQALSSHLNRFVAINGDVGEIRDTQRHLCMQGSFFCLNSSIPSSWCFFHSFHYETWPSLKETNP